MTDNGDPHAQVLTLTSHFQSLFRDQTPDLPAQILSTITSHPGFSSVLALASALLHADPRSLENSIRAIIQVLPDMQKIIISSDDSDDEEAEEEPGGMPFRDTFIMNLIDMVNHSLHEFDLPVDDTRATTVAISPTNDVLTAALSSASIIKHGLLDEISIYGFTRDGLELPHHAEISDPAMKEVVAIGACLQLITAGDVFMVKHFREIDGLENVIVSLERLKDKGVVQYRKGIELLERTIEAAKDNFSTVLSSVDAWNLLFS